MNFEPQIQMYRHDPENGIYGDCLRAAVAMCLGMPAADVPHFCQGESDDGVWRTRLHAWLVPQGLYALEVPWPDLALLLQQAKYSFHHAAITVSGRSPRGTLHECVIYRGKLYDPHPDGGGLVAPHEDGYYWSQIFTKRLRVQDRAA